MVKYYAALGSIVEQSSYRNFELIVLDNGSVERLPWPI